MDFEKATELLRTYANTDRKTDLEQQKFNGEIQLAETTENWKDAETHLRELAKAKADDFVVHQRLARSLCEQGKTVEAYEVLKKADKVGRDQAKGRRSPFLAPETIVAMYSDHENAEQWFGVICRNDWDDLGTREVIFRWALEKGKIAIAQEQAEAVCKIEAADTSGPVRERTRNGVQSLKLRGVLAFWQKNWPTAEDCFQQVIVENPNDEFARNNLALALAEQESPAKRQQALVCAEATFRDDSGNPETLATMGWVLYRDGKFDRAATFLGEALKTAGRMPDPDLATYAAHSLFHQDKKWEAKEILENALKADRAFAMKPEAQRLYEKVKDAKRPEAVEGKRDRP